MPAENPVDKFFRKIVDDMRNLYHQAYDIAVVQGKGVDGLSESHKVAVAIMAGVVPDSASYDCGLITYTMPPMAVMMTGDKKFYVVTRNTKYKEYNPFGDSRCGGTRG